ncbi:hypothetical protein LCGC14_1087370 [marine sediment metagenome]|uniref:Uncharacterized protein n=1 Tax=marine sediment metagenome TaxID=412755 RepID=A0A0F9N138_9ZZZZ
MTKLDEIEAKHTDGYGYDSKPSVMPLADALIDMDLLIRAVRQLGVERRMYQALFEAVDDSYKDFEETHLEVYQAYNDVSGTVEPDPDVLELIGME